MASIILFNRAEKLNNQVMTNVILSSVNKSAIHFHAIYVFMKQSSIFTAALRHLEIFAIAILILGCLGSVFVRESGYKPGIYPGSGRGYRGPVYVQVQTSSGEIEDIIITSHKDSIYPGAAAMEELLELVLETGSTDLDAISGATFSSRGFLEAVEDALGKAAF